MNSTEDNNFNEPALLSGYKAIAIVFLLVIIYTVPATFFLDFIRDTEADRTLISMEMAKGSSKAVPFLLGQEFMTKPPGFYWAQALTFVITGSTAEWAARLPSAVAAAVMVTAIFCFIRKERNLTEAVITSSVLATTGAIFRLSVCAEIDMLFAMFITLALLSAYYTVTSQSTGIKYLAAIVSQIFSALAFLTKGPPVFLFVWLPVIVFFAVRLKSESSDVKTFILANIAGLATFTLITGLWVNSVFSELGKERVIEHFNLQVTKRVTGEGGAHTGKHRGVFYYLGATAKSSIPWTPFLILALYKAVKNKAVKSADSANLPLVFSLCVIFPSLAGLTITAGKASRYMLPLWPFFAIIINWAISMWETTESKKRKTVTAIVIFVVLLRLPWCFGFAPWRNKTSSPRPVAASINKLVPAKQPVYILALMERWICYYLITEEKRTVLRLNKAIASKWHNGPVNTNRSDNAVSSKLPDESSSGSNLTGNNQSEHLQNINNGNDVYILICKDAEAWKLDKLKETAPSTEVVKNYTQNKRNFQLIKTSKATVLQLIDVKDFTGRS